MATRTGSRQTGGRQARQAKRSAQFAAPAYITRKIGYYDFLDEDALAAACVIHCSIVCECLRREFFSPK